MLSRVPTSRRAGLFLHSPLYFKQSSYILSAWNNGGHGPVCKTEGHPLAALGRDASLQAFPLNTEKKDGDVENVQNSCIQSSVSTLRSRKGRSSHGSLNVSDAHGLFPDDEKVSESTATLAGSKATRKKGHPHPSKRNVKGSKSNLASSSSKASTTFLSYGDAMVSESEATCNQGNACEACRQDAGGYIVGGNDSEATALERHAELENPSSTDGPLLLPVTQGQEDSSSSVPCGHPRYTLPLQSLVNSTRLQGTESQIALLDLQQKVELLEAEKISFCDAERLFKTKAFKFASFAQLSAVLEVFRELFGSGEEACQALASSSKFLEHPAELLQVLTVLADFKIEKEATSKFLICRQSPLPLKGEVLQKKLTFFKDLGFSAGDLNTLLRRQPWILSKSLENCILPTLELLESIGFTKKEVLRLLRRRPGVFDYRDENLIKKCKFLQELGFSTPKISIALSFLWQYSLEKLQERVQAIKDLGFSDEDAMLMIRQQPALLSCTPEGLKARIDYLVRDRKRDMSEIVKCPICLMCSLDGRIIPRFRCIEKLSLSKVYSLSSILCDTDLRFKEKFGIVQ